MKPLTYKGHSHRLLSTQEKRYLFNYLLLCCSLLLVEQNTFHQVFITNALILLLFILQHGSKLLLLQHFSFLTLHSIFTFPPCDFAFSHFLLLFYDFVCLFFSSHSIFMTFILFYVSLLLCDFFPLISLSLFMALLFFFPFPHSL